MEFGVRIVHMPTERGLRGFGVVMVVGDMVVVTHDACLARCLPQPDTRTPRLLVLPTMRRQACIGAAWCKVLGVVVAEARC